MTRSDGTFPSYRVIDISAADRPEGWNDGARRCRKCGKAWPRISHFSPSPCCDVEAGIVTSANPDMTWDIAVKELLTARFEKYYERWNENITDEQLMWVDTGDTSYSEHEYKEGLDEIDHLIERVGGMTNAKTSS